MTFHNAVKYITTAPTKTGANECLERTTFLCARLGSPEKKLRYIRFAGSNGKTVCQTMLSSVLFESGYCTGSLYMPARLDPRENIVINNAADKLRILDPFEVGEYSFELARAKNFKEANRYLRILPVLSQKWARFWREVAKDYRRTPEDHPEYDPNGTIIHDGMDDLFRVYLLGWYSNGLPIEEDFKKIFVEKYKDLKKAIELLPVRFKDCNLHEVSEKLYWDLQYVEADSNPDFDSFFRVLVETELLFPGAAEGIYKDGWIDYDNYDQLCEHLWSMGDEMTAEAVKEMIYSGADAEAVEAYLLKMSNVSCDAAYTLYELYKNGHVDTMIAIQNFTLDFPELKNEEKAAEHAKKCNIKHNI